MKFSLPILALAALTAPALHAGGLDDVIADLGAPQKATVATASDANAAPDPAAAPAENAATNEDAPPAELGRPPEGNTEPKRLPVRAMPALLPADDAHNSESQVAVQDSPATTPMPEALPPIRPAENMMPAIPPSAEMASTQAGGVVTFKWNDLPLVDAARLLVRHLEKPIHVAVLRDVRVSGEWLGANPRQVLAEVAQANRLKISESPFAWIIEDEGQPIKLPRADVLVPTVAGSASAMPAAMLIEPVTPLNERELGKRMRKLQEERERLLEEQKQTRRSN